MAIVRRYNRYQGLKDLDVFIEDSAPISQYFNVVEVPDIITQGRSSFIVGGSPLLKAGVELKFEIINDANGKVIYTEAISSYLEGTSRRISIEVYDDPDTFGDATMYFVGELNPNEVDVPGEWQNIYNVRWYSKIYINGAGANTQPIFFYKQPSMWVGEIVQGFVETTYPTGSVTQSAGTVTGDPLPGTEGTQPEPESPGDEIQVLQKSFTSKVFGGGGKNAGIRSRGRRVRRSSPEVETFTLTLEGGDAEAKHIGATFTINSPKAASSFVTRSYHEFPAKFETTIKDVKNSSTLIPTKEFVIKDTRFSDDDERQKVIVPLAATAYTMSFQPAPTHSVSTVNFRSFADIRISKLRTFSGDVNRVKIYSKNKDAFGDFELIADTPIESPELLFDTFGSAGSRRIGYFENQNAINTYWESGSNTIATHKSTLNLDAVYLSGSNKSINSILRFESTGSLPITFYKDIEYSFRAKIVGRKGPKKVTGGLTSIAELGIFVSGSSFEKNHEYGDAFGYQLVPVGETKPGLITVGSDDDYVTSFGIVEEVFQPLRDGTGILQFGAPAGSWYVSDISIRPVSDTGFSPDWIRVVAPVPPLSNERPDDYEFIAEFYDVNNNIADTITHVSASTFQGGNSYILGSDNVLSGSMFIGSAIGSGIEMAGVGSGFVRSIGYLGFTSGSAGTGGPGFMMWSGSVLSDITDEYGGVGLELFGSSTSYMRYRTDPSELDIRADAFFVGNENSQFISGSGGNIEISSSNFHVSSSGDVTMTGTITATAGNIGDWIIKDGKLSGSNATLDATGAALYMSDKGPDTDSSATFDIQRDEYYIDFTPADQGNTTNYFVKFGPNFAVDSSGILVASGAIFEGQITASTGQIGGADIGDTSLAYSPYWRISSSADTTDPASFISSSRFKVSAGGNITGSDVLFTGGKIGGFILGASTLQNIENTVELSSTLPGLSIKDAAGVARVQVKSGSLSTVGGGTQYIGNRSFEDDTISAGRNIRSGSNILSWSFAMGGHSSASLTDRSGYADDDKAVSGDVTLDVVVPAGSGNYSSVNTYELSQIITASISAGDTLSFSSVARFSSSFGGKGKDRALGPQYFRAEYSSSTGWIPFLPTANFTASNGYGEYFLGSGQYNSFGASAELPVAVEYVKLVLTGSINDDTGFSIKKPLYVGAKGTVDASLSGKTFTKNVVGSTTADYPETEITFDNFSVRSNTRKVELSEEGILIYNSEDSFFKMDAAGIEYRGGSGVSSFGSSISRESFTNDSQVAGTLGAPSLQAYVGDPEAIGTTASDGNVGDYSKGNHIHIIAGSTINSALSGITLTNGVWNSTFGATANTLISGSLGANASLIRSLTAVGISGSTVTQSFSDGTATMVSGSKVSTGSFGYLLQNGLPIVAASGTNTGDVTFAGSRDYITISGQEITRNVIDISDDTNLVAGVGINLNADTLDIDFTDSTFKSTISGSLGSNATLIRTLTAVGISGSFTSVSSSLASRLTSEEGEAEGTVISSSAQIATDISGSWQGSIDISSDTNLVGGTGITLTGDTLSTTDSEIVHDSLSGFVANEHIDHTTVSISAGGILSGGGTIASNRTITLASSDVVHDSTTGFVANEHIDHSGVTLTAGTGMSGGGDITTNRTFAVDFSDSTLQTNISGSWQGYITGSGILSSSIQIGSDLSGSWQGYITGSGIVSHSQFSSPSQGTVRATINGITTDVDTGLQSGDTPYFNNLIATGTVSASNFHLTSSTGVVVQMGSSGNTLSKWELHRDGVRKWLFYNDGRTNQAPIPQDSIVFKHGLVTDGADHINFHMQQDDQTVYFHGDISGSGNLNITGNVTASGNISASGTITADTFDGTSVSDTLAAAIVAEIDNDEISGDKIHGGTISNVDVDDTTAANIVTQIDAGEIPIAKLAASTISGVSLGSNLASLSITANGGIGMTSYNGSAAVSDLALDIDGMTDIGAAVATGDLMVIDDGAGGTNRKVTVDRIAQYVSASAFSKVSGDIVIAGTGVATIQANSLDTGMINFDYVQNITGGTGISSTGTTSGEGIQHTLAVDFSDSTLQTYISGSWGGYITGSGIVSASSIASSAQGQVALTTNGVAATAVDLGLQTTDAVTFATVDTGQGANELYDMNQNVKTDSNVTFADITSNGDIAISGSSAGGTATPTDGRLVFNQQYDDTGTSTANKIVLYESADWKAGIGISFNDVDFYSGDNFRFWTGHGQSAEGTERFTILSAGNVGIGTSSPDSKLHVVGDIRATGDIIAQNYIVSSSVTYMTQSFSSGSTIFGDTSDDRHEFTGSAFISSSLTVNQTGSFGRASITSLDITNIDGNWTNAGNTVADGGTFTTIDIDGGDIASGVTINKSPVITLGGDLSGNTTLTTLGNGTLTATIVADSVEGTMLHTNTADTSTLELSSDTLSVLKVPNALTAGLGLSTSTSGTFDGAAAITFAIDSAEFSTVTPANGDLLLTLDSDGSTQQNTAISELATLYSGTGLTATNSVIAVDYGTSAGNAAEGDTTLTLTGATNEITIDAGSGAQAIGSNTAITIGLADTIGGARTFSDDIILSDGEGITNSAYNSGFAGSGWNIDYGITEAGKGSAEFDNLTIRGTMSVYEMLIHQVRATNGSIWVSNTGKIESSSYGAGAVGERTYTLFFSSGSGAGHGFRNADSIRAQRWSPTGDLYRSDLFVLSTDIDTNGTGSLTATLSGSSDEPVAGMDYVRIGNISGSASSSRQGAIYLTSDDSNAPYIDVVDGVTHHDTFNTSGNIKTRMGKLSGITSPTMGALSGYGFYASGSAFLEGKINATAGGKIAGWEISSSFLGKSTISLNSDVPSLRISDATRERLRVGDLKGVGGYSSTQFGIIGFDGTGTTASEVLFELSDNRNVIADWAIAPGSIQYDSSGGSLALAANSQSISIFTGSLDFARPKISLGKLPNLSGDANLDRYGLAVFTGTVDADITDDKTYTVLITKDKARLAGWDLIPGNIQSDNTDGSVRLSSISQSLTIWTGSVDEAQPKLVLGKLPLHDGTVDSPYGFAVFSGAGTVSGSQDSASVLITANKARLAGWDLTPGKLSSGTVASIDGNNASIALGTGATTATGTPTDGLFFVSASTSPVFYVGSNFSYVDDVLTAGGWKIGNGIISSSVSDDTDGVILDATNKVLTFHGADGKDSFHTGRDNVRLAVGQISSNIYGMIGYDGSGNTLLELSETQALIAGWTINTNTITSTNTILGLGYISLGSGISAYNSANRIYIDGNNTQMSMGTGFRYTSDALTIDGSATIGGWTIDADEIKSGTTFILDSDTSGGQIKIGASAASLSMTAGTGFYADGGGNFKAGTANGYGIFWDASTLQISSSEFYLGDATNYISGSGGAITVAADTFDLKTTYMRVSSSYGGTIAMGKTIPTSISGSGIFLSGSGDFLAGNHAGNKIQYAQGPGAIVMKSSTFSLDATTIVIDSSANDGKIALGASPNTSVAGTNAGIYMDGQGDFLVYGSATNFLKFDQSDGSIDMKSDTFGLGTATMVISSSVNSGTVRLGSNGGPISYNANSSGIYMDGTGKFQVYGDSDNYLRWDGSDFTIKGDLTVDNIRTPATIGGSPSTILNASSSITSQGYARFVSASIGGWDVGTDSLTSGNVGLHSTGYSEGAELLLGHATAYASAKIGLKEDGSGKLASGNIVWNTGGDITFGSVSSENIHITSGGDMLFRNATTTIAEMDGTTWTIGGPTGTTADAVVIASDSVTIYGNNSSTGVFITDDQIEIKSDADADKITIDNDGMTITANSVVKAAYHSTGSTFYGDNLTTYTRVNSSGMTIVDDGTTQGTFTNGVVTLFGGSANDKVEIDSDGLLITTGGVPKAAMHDTGSTFYGDNLTTYTKVTSAGLTIVDDGTTQGTFSGGTVTLFGGSANDKIEIDSDGLLITTNNLPRAAMHDTGSVFYGDALDTYSRVNASGMSIVLDGTERAAIGSDITLNGGTIQLNGTSTNDRVVINADGMAVYTANVLKASIYDAGFTAYGDNLTTYTSMTSAGITIVDDSVTTGTFTSGTVTLYGASSNDRVVINADGMAIYTANVLKASAYDAGFTAYGDNLTTYTSMTSAGITMVDDSVTTGTFTSGTVTLYGASSNDRVVINADGMAVYTANVLKSSAYDAGFTAYGDNLTTYTSMTSAGITIVDDSVTTGTFTAGTVTLYGASSNDRVVINNTGMSVYTNNVLKASALDAGFTAYGDDVNTYATVTSTGLTIFEDSTDMANFGSTMRVGVNATDKSALRVAADGTLTIGTSNTTNVSITAAGALEITGSFTANSGRIGGASGWEIGTGFIRSENNITIANGATSPLWYYDGDDEWMGIAYGVVPAAFDSAASTGSYWIQREARTIFRVGNASQYVKVDSGATNVLEVKGNITADTITATTSGNIAGFKLTSNQLEATGSTSGTGIKMSAAATAEKITVGDFDGDRIELDGAEAEVNFFIANSNRIKLGRGIGWYENRDGIEVQNAQFSAKNQVKSGSTIVNASHFSSHFLLEDDNSVSNRNFSGTRTLGIGGGTDSNTAVLNSAIFTVTNTSQGPDTSRPFIAIHGSIYDQRDAQGIDVGGISNPYWIAVQGEFGTTGEGTATLNFPMWGGHFSNAVKIEGTPNPGTSNRAAAHNARLYLANTDTVLADAQEIGSIHFVGHDPADNSGTLAASPSAIYDDDYTYGRIVVEAEAGGSVGLWASWMRFVVQDEGTEREMITIDGENQKVGINDTTPSYTLDVAGDIRVTDDLFVDDFASLDSARIGTTQTDPGTGNLFVEGEIIGGTRGHYFFGESTTFNADRYLDMAQGHQSNNTDGVTAMRAGSITGISANFAVTAVSTAAASGRYSWIELEVRKNGTDVFSSTLLGSSDGATSYTTGAKSKTNTQARGTDTVAAGDDLAIYINITNFSDSSTSSTTMGDITAYVEITYDT